MIAIHIGMSKAGSSTIQNFFSKNRRKLLHLGLDYPDVGRSENNHHNLAQEIFAPHKFNPDHGTLEQLLSYRKISPKPTLFLSSEVFAFYEDDHVAALQRLSSSGDDFLIVLVIRDHVDRIPSSYAQKVKYGRHKYDFDKFFRQTIKDKRLDYYAIAERWAGSFGWDRLSVKVLDNNFLLNGDLIDEVLATLGVKPDAGATSALDRTEIRNVSPGWRVLEAMRALANGTHGLPENHPLLEAVKANGRELTLGALAIAIGGEMGWNDDKGLYLTRKQAQQCLDLYRDHVQALNARIKELLPMPRDLKGRGFKARDSLPSLDLLPRQQLNAFYDHLAERWFEGHRRKNKFSTPARPKSASKDLC